MKKTISIADKPTLDEVKALLENSGYGLSALKSLLSSGNSVVKSVQRGTAEIGGNGTSVEIKISTINMNKSILILSDTAMPAINDALNIRGRISSNTTLNFFRYNLYNGSASCTSAVDWQVIEFY